MHSRSRRAVTGVLATAALVAAIALPSSVLAAGPSRQSKPTFAPPDAQPVERLLVQFAPGVGGTKRLRIARDLGLERVDALPELRLELLADGGRDLRAVAKELAARPDVLSVEEDRPHYAFDDPTTEPWFEDLWGLHNTGQVIQGFKGTSNVDIDLPQAHAVTAGDDEIVIAVIDDGVDFSHPDLASRAWVNEDEIPNNGVDDDGNEIIDDVHGVNYCADEPDGDVFGTGSDHGTHVAGTIAASLNDLGVVGVAPNVKIMALRFLCPAPLGEAGDTLDAIKAIQYASDHGVHISNNSWGGGSFSSALRNAIGSSGMLFVAAAGNGGTDGKGDNIDVAPVYPASYDLPNILSVAAVHNEGALSSFSNHGKASVDVSAPGEDILSTWPPVSGCPAPCYAWVSGTSMAAPHVSGVAALAATVRPGLLDDPVALKARLLAATKPLSSTAGKTVTGGMVDALYAVDTVAPTSAGPSSQAFITGERIGTSALTRLRWGAGSDDLSGVGSYVVHRSLNGGGSWSTLASKATTTSLDTKVALGSAVRYRVRARDRGGNVGSLVEGPTIRAQISQQGTSAAKYGSGWKKAKSSSASGGSTSYATKTGASVTYTFTGRAIAIVAPKASNRGSFKVYINGTLAGTVSTYAKKTKTRVVVFARSWTTSQKRTIKLVVSGTKGHPRVDVDAFLVLR